MTNVVPILASGPLFDEPCGRPGDWWEPFPFTAGEIAAEVRREAASLGLPLDLVVALLIERGHVISDISECGIGLDRAVLAFERGETETPSAGPGRLHTTYVRMLRSGVPNPARENERQLAQRDLVLPLRLYGAARKMGLEDLGQHAAIDEAIRWEIAAARNAQFMREWALRVLLAETAAAVGC